jgi:hypothetical protein
MQHANNINLCRCQIASFTDTFLRQQSRHSFQRTERASSRTKEIWPGINSDEARISQRRIVFRHRADLGHPAPALIFVMRRLPSAIGSSMPRSKFGAGILYGLRECTLHVSQKM